jgi:hypothetical protein
VVESKGRIENRLDEPKGLILFKTTTISVPISINIASHNFNLP